MTASIKELILARASQMATQDGVAPAIVHVVGAVNHIHLELARARDELVAPGAIWTMPAVKVSAKAPASGDGAPPAPDDDPPAPAIPVRPNQRPERRQGAGDQRKAT